MNRTILLSSLLVASAASAQVQIPVQGFLTDSGLAVVGNQTLEFRTVDDGGADLTCESQALTLDAGFFAALLGQPGATACASAEPTTLPPELFGAPLSLEVSLGATVLGLFPLGDAPSAGFAKVAARVADELPGVFRAPDAQALLDALAVAGDSPTVIELGAGTYALPANTVVPKLTDIRGQGALTTSIDTNALLLSGNNRLSGLSVRNVAPNGVSVVLRPAPGETIELIDTLVIAAPLTGGAFGIVVDQNADSTSTLVLRDSEIKVQAVDAALALIDERGMKVRMHNTRIQAQGVDVSVAIRIGLGAQFAPNFDYLISDTVIENTGTGTELAGIQIFADGGIARVMDANIRVFFASGSAIELNGGSVRVHSSLLFADELVFARDVDALRIANSGIEAFTSVIAAGSAVPSCVGSYNDATAQAVGAACQ